MKALLSRLQLYCILIITIYLSVSIGSVTASQFSPAIIVNNITISKYEVNERRKLLLALGTEKASARRLAKENLINEALQKLHASTINVTVGENQLKEVVDSFRSMRSMSQNELKTSLRKYGSSLEELRAYLKANVLMRNIISRTYHSRMSINDFDFTLFRPVASTTIPTQISLSEIIIPFAIRGKENTIKLGERIFNDLMNGKNFDQLAKRFSRAGTSKNGGLIGYVPLNSIPEELQSILRKLKSGNFSNPIITTDTVMIFKVNSWKSSERTRKLPSEVTFAITAVEQNNSDKCQDLDKNALEGPMREKLLSEVLRKKIKLLRPSESVIFTDSDGDEKKLLLCDRRIVLSENKIQILKGQLLEKRLSKLAEGLNLDLKRTAKIKILK
ncbi:MAG: peptidylprolyl isomerase [Pseudomonadota bacterium]|nr:peptidylprolyl isomerase [Pseudomonadota bacterium]